MKKKKKSRKNIKKTYFKFLKDNATLIFSITITKKLEV